MSGSIFNTLVQNPTAFKYLNRMPVVKKDVHMHVSN